MSRGSAAGRLSWYAHRLRAMSPPEIAWRVWRAALALVGPALDGRRGRTFRDEVSRERALERFLAATGPGVLLDREHAERVRSERPEEVAALVAAAEDVLAGRVRYFGYPEVVLDRPVDWSRDLLTGYDWPTVPAHRIDHRTAPADPKWIWELNRLQHLPWLAQAWMFTGRDELGDAAADHLDTWLEQNPVGEGIAWRGAFEAGVRAVSLALTLQGLRGSAALTPELFERAVEVLRASARLCWRERSLFSSANNHLVGEMTGLVTVATVLPFLPESRRWRRRGLRVLAREADRQLLPDGAGAEQAVGYQVFTAELLLLTRVLAGPGRESEVISRAVGRSAAYLAGVVGDGEPAPRYGDDDEGFAVRVGTEAVRTVADHLLVVASVGAETATPGGGLLAAWLRAASQGLAPVPVPTPGRGSWYAADGGLVVLRHGGRRVTVDVGPLGHLAIAAHGHADALALTYALDGRRVVDDPGTGSYYGHPDWRTAHRSTRAHATLTVDGEDQSVMGGPFLWTRHAQVRVLEVDLERGVVEAEHDGYERLAAPVRHRRRLEATPGEDALVVVDVLHGQGHHHVSLAWPLAPDLEATQGPDGHLVRDRGHPLLQVASVATVPLVHDQVVGDEETHLGWWSDRLEHREPAPLLRSTGQGAVPLVLATVLRPVDDEGRPVVHDLEVAVEGGLARVRWLEGPRTRSLVVPLPAPD